MNNKAVMLAVLSSAVLLGCQNTPIEPGEVKANWSRSLHQLGIVPVFPPREDIYVGDVYSFDTDPEKGKYLEQLFKEYESLTQDEKIELISLGMESRLARLPLNDLISNEYTNTISVPQTSSDYNTILGNPSVVAIEDKINNQKQVIASLESEIASLNQEKKDASERLKNATRAKEDSDVEVTKLLSKLESAKANPRIPGDTSEFDTQLIQENINKRQKEDELAQVEYELLLVEPDSDEEKKLKRKEKLVTYELGMINTTISRLQEDKTAVPSSPYDYSNEQALYDQSVINQLAAQNELTEATRHHTDIIAENDTLITAKTTSLSSEKAKLTELNNLKKSILSVDAKTLFKQPNASQKNIYSWADIGVNNDPARLNRLKLVAFPEFTSTMVSQKDLSALIPAEALAFNISSSAVETISIKIPSAESYGIAFDTLAATIFDINGAAELTINDSFKSLIHAAKVKASLLNEGDIKPTDKIYLRIITEVFYARAFDINMFSNSSFGAVVDYAKLPTVENDIDSTEKGDGKDDYSHFNGVINSSATADQGNVLSQLKSNLTRTQNVPGGTVQMLSYSDSSIGLRRVFDRPIAVGFRGVTLEVYPCHSLDANNNCIIKLGKLTTAVSPVSLTPSF